jgi:predicted transposase/invertase (TIGR01784 family)
MTSDNNNHNSVNNPHDRLVKSLLANTNHAREIIEAYLPPQILALMDLTFLEQQADTFIDARHRMHQTDILFKNRCQNTQEEAYIWVLIEQQTDPDVWLPLRVFCYIAVIWDTLRKKSKSRAKSVKIPFIFPLIISNASKAYPFSLNLRDLIEPEAAKPLFDELFKNPIQLIDLSVIPDKELREQLQNRVHAEALLLTLKHIYNENFQEYLEKVLIHSLQLLDTNGYRDEVANLLYYIYNEGNLNDKSHFFAFLHHKFSKDVEEEVMSLGQRAIREADLQATRRAFKETALRMLEKNCDIQLISEITHLTYEEIKQLAKKKTN